MMLPTFIVGLLWLVTPSSAHSIVPTANMTASVTALCTGNSTGAMPYSTACTLVNECNSKISTTADGVLTSASVTTPAPPKRNATECSTTVLYAALCADPLNINSKPCQPFSQLCVTGNGTDPVCDSAEMLPLDDFNLTTVAAWNNLQGLCAYHAAHLGRIYNLTTGVSVIDPSARRRSLLHNGVDHSAAAPMSMGTMVTGSTLNNTGVPHNEAAHEYCQAVRGMCALLSNYYNATQCLKTSTNVTSMAKDCPQGPLIGIAGLCSMKPQGTGMRKVNSWLYHSNTAYRQRWV